MDRHRRPLGSVLFLVWALTPRIASGDDCAFRPDNFGTLFCQSAAGPGGPCSPSGGGCAVVGGAGSRTLACRCFVNGRPVDVAAAPPSKTSQCEQGITKAVGAVSSETNKCLNKCERASSTKGSTVVNCATAPPLTACLDDALKRGRHRIADACGQSGPPACANADELLQAAQNAIAAYNSATYCVPQVE
jgi:hypothetical protein